MWVRWFCFGMLLLCLPLATKADPATQDPIAEVDASEKVRVILDSLGGFEKRALRRSLKKYGLTLEGKPEGKTLGRVRGQNLKVFGPDEGFFQIFNILHATTRWYVIDREVLLRPGQEWNESVVRETMRRLKDPLFTSFAVVVPVKGDDEEHFDLLVITRDIWSLRMNSVFEYVQAKLVKLQLSIAENNMLGRRKHGSLVFLMSQSNAIIGPQYIDKALGGTRLRLSSGVSAIFGRNNREFEGTTSSTVLSYPLWALSTAWGASVSFSHFDAPVRSFVGTEVEQYDNPDTEEVEAVDRIYDFQRFSLDTSGVRSFGYKVKQNLTFGHSFSTRRPGFYGEFIGDNTLREAFIRDVFPRSERASAFFVSYRLFMNDFVVYRDLNSYDLAEDIRLGPDINASVSVARKEYGSQRNFSRASLSASWVFDWDKDGFIRPSASASTRIQNSETIDNLMASELKIASPRIRNTFRVVARANLSVRIRERNNGRFFLGGDSGLRGYLISEFIGQKRVIGNLELRSMPAKLLFGRIGGLVFWDVGDAADRMGELSLKHGVGLGVRGLVPQLQPVVFRLDWAIPLQGPSAGFPGRISAGVEQVF